MKTVSTREELIAHVMAQPDVQYDFPTGATKPLWVERVSDAEQREIDDFWADVERRLQWERRKENISITYYLIASPTMFLMAYPDGRIVEVTLPNGHSPFRMRLIRNRD